MRGNFVNIPIDIAPTVNTLPRSLNDTETVTIKFKRKKQYKKCDSQAEGESEVDQVYSAESSICGDGPEENEPNDMSDDDGIIFTGEDNDNLETCVIDNDTTLDDYEPIIPQPDEPLIPKELTFAPGEGQIPVSLFKDENAEYLAFPTIFCGQKRPDNCDRVQKVHYSDIYASMN